MRRARLLCSLFILPALQLAQATTGLSPEETAELQQRLTRFYASPGDPAAMNQRVPKYSLSKKKFVKLNRFLELQQSTDNPLLKLAQGKATDSFIERNRRPRPAPKPFGEWAAVEPDDRVEQLGQGWLTGPVVYHLNYIPTSGQTALPLWSDDYWKTQYGGISYRYSAYDEHPMKYPEAVGLYVQPNDWFNLLNSVALPEVASYVVPWSPAEKYDLLVGDENFSLTRQQKNEGSGFLKDGDVEEWIGVCTGWSAASMMAARPLQPVTLIGARGVPVTFYQNDIKALMSLTWANSSYYVNSIGGTCRIKNAQMHANGRVAQQECFDNSPATFHLALGNLIGKEKKSFIMDKTFDYEIWNQPLHSYQFTYFNPLNPKLQSKDWNQVAVNYDATFKQYDRFQRPNTRGVRQGVTYSDRNVRKVVGVIASVVYMAELDPPEHSAAVEQDEMVRVNYTYDLELYDYGGHLYPMGGEWHENQHPDYLWLPQRDAFAYNDNDLVQLGYTGATAPAAHVTRQAQSASSQGQPLCQVVKELLRRATGVDSYKCPGV